MRPAPRSFIKLARVNFRPARRGLLTQSYSRGPSQVSQALVCVSNDSLWIASTARANCGRALPFDRLSIRRPYSVSSGNSRSWTLLDVLPRVVSRHQRTRLTYDGLDRKSNDLARGLLQRGVKRGDRVAVSLGNNIEYAIVRGLGIGTRLRG